MAERSAEARAEEWLSGGGADKKHRGRRSNASSRRRGGPAGERKEAGDRMEEQAAAAAHPPLLLLPWTTASWSRTRCRRPESSHEGTVRVPMESSEMASQQQGDSVRVTVNIRPLITPELLLGCTAICFRMFTTLRGLTKRGAQLTPKEEDQEAELVHQSYEDIDTGQRDQGQEDCRDYVHRHDVPYYLLEVAIKKRPFGPDGMDEFHAAAQRRRRLHYTCNNHFHRSMTLSGGVRFRSWSTIFFAGSR